MAKGGTHELTFCADAKKWIEEELSTRPELVFGRATIEESARGSRQRRDLSIYDRHGTLIVTGEVKFPWDPEGHTPFHEKVVGDAHSKAAQVGAPFFITWNVNRLVLWKTDVEGKPLYDRDVWEISIVQVRDADDLAKAPIVQAIRHGLRQFLERASLAVTGQMPLERRPLDEFFLRILEAALDRPIALVQSALHHAYRTDRAFRDGLCTWMRDVQGWPLADDETVVRDNLERAAKFSCYVLVNKVVFYNALRKRFTRLPSLRFRRNGKAEKHTAQTLKAAFDAFFTAAKAATKDYETIFDGDFGDELPFTTDAVVPAWLDFVRDIDRFDFTQINYDIIGPIFERLISPEERHRYGQHYTKPEIVDLINAFCIRRADARVLDPACGGGTFLVRAYNRKKYLSTRQGAPLVHQSLLDQLFGVDISAYAAHLTMLNLATRDLIDERNYPLVAHDDFFDVRPDAPIFHLPFAKSTSGVQLRTDVAIPHVDAVVGNPPYVRQEEISKPPTARTKARIRLSSRSLQQLRTEAERYKTRLRQLVLERWPRTELSGRSDLHIYFWPHASSFLRDGGYFGFVTSSSWLDVEYGFRLQQFLLEHFAILAIFESAVEPWFTGARVSTCATVLRRERDPEKRRANRVRFVQLRTPLTELLPAGVTEEDRQAAVEALRDRIESLSENTMDPHWRVRVVSQEELANDGCRGTDTYQGGKWGIPLRAPDVFFHIADRFRKRLVPLGEIAEIRYGVKTGCDRFFFPRDVTDRCLAEFPDDRVFRDRYGIHRYQTDRIRIVRAGDGSIHLVEAEFLEPEVHNLMEIDSVLVKPENCARRILLCALPKSALKGKKVLRYVEWGEKEEFHTGPTCAGRATSRPWYDLSASTERGDLFWPMAQQYRHVIPLNQPKLICNHNLFDVFAPPGMSAAVLCGVLNSTVVALMKHLYGRWAGAEGNLKTEVVDVRMMVVPDPRGATHAVARRITRCVEEMAKRRAPNLTDELEFADRQQLDDAVFELLGERDPDQRRQLREELYAAILTMHGVIRGKELRAIENKKTAKNRRQSSPMLLAAEILKEFDPALLRRFPDDFLQADWPIQLVELPSGSGRLEANDLLGENGLHSGSTYVELGDVERARFAKQLSDLGLTGPRPVPVDPAHCRSALQRYVEYVQQLDTELADRVAAKTTDPKLQARLLRVLQSRLKRADPAIEP